jgi:ankyrin repeat protein
MDKLRAQYELHKKYRKNLNTNIQSSSNSVRQESTNAIKPNDSSSTKTVSETTISSGSGDTEKTSTSSTSVRVERSNHERINTASSYRSLGNVVRNDSLETKPKSEIKKGGFCENKTNRNTVEQPPRRKTKSLEKHLEENSVPNTSALRKLSCETSTVDTNIPRGTSQSNGFVPPTEAQLRWAQFHQKQRADATKARVSALMKSPLHACEVEGALDGDSNSISSSDEHPSRDFKKCNEISSGRRALLRISAQKMEERSRYIKKFGFKMKPDNGNEESEEDQTSNHQSSSVDEVLVFEEIAAALQDPHDEDLSNDYKGDTTSNDKDTVSNSKKVKTARKKNSCARRLKGMRSIVQNADEDEQRMKRFEEAYNLLSKVEKDSNPSEAPLITSSKRWSRDSSMPISPSIDGRIYGDLQRSPTFRHQSNSKYYGPEVMGAEINGKKLSDKSASWMMHLPKKDKRKVNFFGQNAPYENMVDEYPDFISPQKLKLMQIVDKVQGDEPKSEQFDPTRGSKRSFDIKQNIVKGAKILFEHESTSGSDEIAVDQEEISFTRSDGDYPQLENKIQSMFSGLTTKNVIDTDGQSESSDQSDGMEHDRFGSLMLSPRILTKRLNQAITAIATCNWNQVRALIRANHWLADMADVNDDQYLLHKLSYYGAGTIDFEGSSFAPAPKTLFEEMIQTSNTIVHKVDNHGNLPLHLAAESGNYEMVSCLCISFPGGASVRNEEGLLPLHLAILSCSNPSLKNPLAAVTEILKIFPLALVVSDNNGNLPIHMAAAHLRSEIGAQVVHILLDEAEKQGRSLRISSGRTFTNDFDMNDLTPIEEDFNSPEVSMLSVKNGLGWNPLVTAIHRGASWQVLDAFLSRDGIENIISERDNSGKTILQLTISKEDCDGPSVVSILRAAPNLVMVRDEKTGALPIEIACLNGLQSEVITAIVLLDLPIDLDGEGIKYRESFGGSWWYINCDCDDKYAEIVDEILELCEYEQKRALCFIKNKASESLISRATPECRKRLRKSLRFAGRYEFVGSADKTGVPKNIKVFEAIDFGAEENYGDDGRKIILMYYEDRDHYIRDVSICPF